MAIGKLSDGKWAVNGTPIYEPSKSDFCHDNMVSSDSGRVETGKMHITWIRGDIRKVNLTYNVLTGAEVEYMVNLMQGKQFQFTYEDNGSKTIDAYTGKCTYSQHTLALYPEEGGIYTDFKINVIEM